MTGTPQQPSVFHDLEHGAAYHFRDWPNLHVPTVAAGVYTIWANRSLLYVGMSGRSLNEETIQAHRAARATGKGLFSRLNSHAGGRRSGDQFCIYVCDRLILPTLSPDQIGQIAEGVLSLDRLTRQYIHDRLSYRFIESVDGVQARAVEAAVRSGALSVGKPFLNPLA